MKKLILSIVALSTLATASFAQKVNEQSFKDKVAKATEATQDPKKGIKGSTWISLGDAYLAAANAYTASVYPGMSEAEAVLLVGKPESESIPVVTIAGEDFKHYEYSGLNLYFSMEGTLTYFMQKSPIIENALQAAYDSYVKAIEVDAKAKAKAAEGLINLIVAARAEGSNAYGLEDFSMSADKFVIAATAANHPDVDEPTANELLFFAAVTLLQSERHAESLEFLNKLAEAGDYRDGDVYNYMAMAHTALEQSDKVEAILIEGLEKFQANQGILNSLISYYITANEDPNKVIPYIKKAQEANPTDANLFIAEGLAYESMGDPVKSIEAYAAAVEIAPTFFDASYNYALATYRYGTELIKNLAGIDLSNQSELDAKEGEAIEQFRLAAERMEKAFEIDSTNRDAMEVLRSVYFRLSGNRLTKDNAEYSASYAKYRDMLQ